MDNAFDGMVGDHICAKIVNVVICNDMRIPLSAANVKKLYKSVKA